QTFAEVIDLQTYRARTAGQKDLLDSSSNRFSSARLARRLQVFPLSKADRPSSVAPHDDRIPPASDILATLQRPTVAVIRRDHDTHRGPPPAKLSFASDSKSSRRDRAL